MRRQWKSAAFARGYGAPRKSKEEVGNFRSAIFLPEVSELFVCASATNRYQKVTRLLRYSTLQRPRGLSVCHEEEEYDYED
jgi:hypothetical protein